MIIVSLQDSLSSLWNFLLVYHYSGGGLVAKDALGDDVTVTKWLSTHLPGDRSLVQVSVILPIIIYPSIRGPISSSLMYLS